MTPVWRCVGGCDRIVSSQGAICGFCPLPDPPRPAPAAGSLRAAPSTVQQLDTEILAAAFKRRFGTSDERKEAQEKLTFLINVLQHETMNPKPKQKETK